MLFHELQAHALFVANVLRVSKGDFDAVLQGERGLIAAGCRHAFDLARQFGSHSVDYSQRILNI